ncbi:MAG: DUF6034 family protein [Eubacteriales bacterium]|nr:DUF6034 family protein [Eubacteriales bacterium]
MNPKHALHLFVFVGLLLAAAFALAACQPTPKDDLIINKSEGALQDAVDKNPSTAQYEAPSIWKEEISNGDTTYRFDAAVVLPDATAYPVLQIRPSDFDMRVFSAFFQIFQQNFNLYLEIDSSYMTKNQIQEAMDVISEQMESVQVNYPNMTSEEIQAYLQDRNEEMQELQEQYAGAPDSNIQRKLTRIEDATGQNWITDILATDPVTDSPFARLHFNAAPDTDRDTPLATCWFRSTLGPYNTDTSEIGTWDTSGDTNRNFDDAKRMAETLVARIGLGEYQYNCIYKNQMAGCVDVLFTKQYNGIPITYANCNTDFSLNTANPEEYAKAWGAEYVCVQVENDGIRQVIWKSPSEQVGVRNDNVALISFEQIQEICRRNLSFVAPMETRWAGIDERTVVVTKVQLGLMCIRELNTQSSYLVVPVWDLFGYTIDRYASAEDAGGYLLNANNELITDDMNQTAGILTINAIDGSILNRALGY